MALDINPGPGCESLASVQQADAYHEARGNAAWDVLEPTRKEQLLRNAYDKLLADYAARWPTEFEFGADDEFGNVPARVRDACARLALYAIEGPLDAELPAQMVEDTVGPMTTKYAKIERAETRRTFPDVARMIGPYLVPAGNPHLARLVRA